MGIPLLGQILATGGPGRVWSSCPIRAQGPNSRVVSGQAGRGWRPRAACEKLLAIVPIGMPSPGRAAAHASAASTTSKCAKHPQQTTRLRRQIGVRTAATGTAPARN